MELEACRVNLCLCLVCVWCSRRSDSVRVHMCWDLSYLRSLPGTVSQFWCRPDLLWDWDTVQGGSRWCNRFPRTSWVEKTKHFYVFLLFGFWMLHSDWSVREIDRYFCQWLLSLEISYMASNLMCLILFMRLLFKFRVVHFYHLKKFGSLK